MQCCIKISLTSGSLRFLEYDTLRAVDLLNVMWKVLFLTSLAISWIAGRHIEWMKNQREPSAGKEAMREHGKTVKQWIFSTWDTVCVIIWCNIEECVYSPTGRCWRRTNLAHSRPPWKRSCSSQKGKGLCVRACVCVQRHVKMTLLYCFDVNDTYSKYIFLLLLQRVMYIITHVSPWCCCILFYSISALVSPKISKFSKRL